MAQMAAGRPLAETAAVVVTAVVVVSHPSSYKEVAIGEFLAAKIRLFSSILVPILV